MKLPSKTEKKILDETGPAWISGVTVKSRYETKHGKIPNGTFYTMLRRLEENGWVSSRSDYPAGAGDQRHRYFCTTKQTKDLKGALGQIEKAMQRANKKEKV